MGLVTQTDINFFIFDTTVQFGLWHPGAGTRAPCGLWVEKIDMLTAQFPGWMS